MRMTNTQVGRSAGAGAADRAADIYNRAGQSYALYADGDPGQLFSFGGLHGYADHCLWSAIEAELAALRATGARSVSVLDIGCGPGTWLRRVVARAKAMGFTRVTARGFDVADAQIRSARLLAQEIAMSPGIKLIFDVADLADPFADDDASVDITLCLYSVLRHLVFWPGRRIP
jgi:SAM-dependent methyltransferase